MDEMMNKGNSKLGTWNVHAVIIWHGVPLNQNQTVGTQICVFLRKSTLFDPVTVWKKSRFVQQSGLQSCY